MRGVTLAAKRVSAPRPFGTTNRSGTFPRPTVPASTTSKGPTMKATR